jgi:hypothetical protein
MAYTGIWSDQPPGIRSRLRKNRMSEEGRISILLDRVYRINTVKLAKRPRMSRKDPIIKLISDGNPIPVKK